MHWTISPIEERDIDRVGEIGVACFNGSDSMSLRRDRMLSQFTSITAVNRYIRPLHLRRALEARSEAERREGTAARMRTMLSKTPRKATAPDGTIAAYAVWVHSDQEEAQKQKALASGASVSKKPSDPTLDPDAYRVFCVWLDEHDQKVIQGRQHWCACI